MANLEQYKACMRRAREYERIARSCEAQLASLDRESDPDHRGAARELMAQWVHGENMAAEAERYAMRARYGT